MPATYSCAVGTCMLMGAYSVSQQPRCIPCPTVATVCIAVPVHACKIILCKGPEIHPSYVVILPMLYPRELLWGGAGGRAVCEDVQAASSSVCDSEADSRSHHHRSVCERLLQGGYLDNRQWVCLLMVLFVS